MRPDPPPPREARINYAIPRDTRLWKTQNVKSVNTKYVQITLNHLESQNTYAICSMPRICFHAVWQDRQVSNLKVNTWSNEDETWRELQLSLVYDSQLLSTLMHSHQHWAGSIRLLNSKLPWRESFLNVRVGQSLNLKCFLFANK
jgi:hypothetical protein